MGKQAFHNYIAACARSEADGVKELLRSRISVLDNAARINEWFIKCCRDNCVTEAELLLKTCSHLINLRTYGSRELWYIYRGIRAAILELLVKYSPAGTFYASKGQFLRYMLRHSRYEPIQTLMFDHEGWFDWDNPCRDTLRSICRYANLSLIKPVFNRLGSNIKANTICGLFSDIRHRYDQILIFFLDSYACILTPQAIQWALIGGSKHKTRGNISIIVDKCMDKLTETSYNAGLIHCHQTSNYELMDQMLTSYANKIRSKPRFIKQALRYICVDEDIDTIGFLLERCGPVISERMFKISCEVGDLETCRLLIDTHRDQLVSCIPNLLWYACTDGDVDVVELLVDAFEDSIAVDKCASAFAAACSSNHRSIIKILARRFPLILNFGSNEDHALWIPSITTKTARLLDRIYGTTLVDALMARAMTEIEELDRGSSH